ncbi:MAG TPA: hypothetical protein VK525_00180 [Candidatus Saccharimonadales bacterium]|nr:hypothetical protein [Candidatus Saccharimonadales bacterium]
MLESKKRRKRQVLRMETNLMKHYAIEQWVDYANKLVSQTQNSAMSSHLAECPKCSALAAMWTKVSLTASRQTSLDVPESALQHVRNAFKVLIQPKRGRLFEVPRLVFDSAWQPAVAGIRALSAAPRQVLYQVGRVVVDMRMELHSDSGRLWLEGQVMNAELKGKGIEFVTVQLMSGPEQLAVTATNRFGEFQVECRTAENIEVSLEISSHESICIPLDESIWQISSKKH